MKLRCLAIDDEPLALQQLCSYIERSFFLELSFSSTRSKEALEFLEKNTVDLMFADIEMPDLSGMDLVKALKNPPQVIFTTAYESYAVESYRVNALDYLLKPFSYADFNQAAQKALNRPVDNHIFVKSEYQVINIDLSQVTYIESMKDYVRIYRPPERPVMTLASLKSFEERLRPHGFMRVHRSFLLNLNEIQRIEKSFALLSDGKEVPIGDQFREAFMEYIAANSLKKK
ncbi:MAG: response regulator transcription factor [Fibrobacter sp.]|nr:response regulator transcription factor [Fibrobacter sp.]